VPVTRPQIGVQTFEVKFADHEVRETKRTIFVQKSFREIVITASAGPSANDVMPGCRSYLRKGTKSHPHPDTKEEEACVAKIEIAELFPLFGGPPGPELAEVCVPPSATPGQEVAVVVKYIDEHPEDMHLDFGLLSYEALLKAWPCKAGQHLQPRDLQPRR
jgi:hypothetical protein